MAKRAAWGTGRPKAFDMWRLEIPETMETTLGKLLQSDPYSQIARKLENDNHPLTETVYCGSRGKIKQVRIRTTVVRSFNGEMSFREVVSS